MKFKNRLFSFFLFIARNNMVNKKTNLTGLHFVGTCFRVFMLNLSAFLGYLFTLLSLNVCTKTDAGEEMFLLTPLNIIPPREIILAFS